MVPLLTGGILLRSYSHVCTQLSKLVVFASMWSFVQLLLCCRLIVQVCVYGRRENVSNLQNAQAREHSQTSFLVCLFLDRWMLIILGFLVFIITPKGFTTLVANEGLEKARAYLNQVPQDWWLNVSSKGHERATYLLLISLLGSGLSVTWRETSRSAVQHFNYFDHQVTLLKWGYTGWRIYMSAFRGKSIDKKLSANASLVCCRIDCTLLPQAQSAMDMLKVVCQPLEGRQREGLAEGKKDCYHHKQQ